MDKVRMERMARIGGEIHDMAYMVEVKAHMVRIGMVKGMAHGVEENMVSKDHRSMNVVWMKLGPYIVCHRI